MTTAEFIELLSGTWLIGWSGNLDHYSWIRFGSGSAMEILGDPGGPTSVTPLWSCSGSGAWNLLAVASRVRLTLPSGCGTSANETLDFVSTQEPSTPFTGALLRANVQRISSGDTLQAYKYSDTQCDGGMTACISPWP
jgi:hypothetical protein